jgi:hypothetical protein
MPEKHGYEQVSVSDMREELRRDFPEDASDNNLTLKKTPLALLLNELKRKKGDTIVDDKPSDEEPVDFANITVEVDESLDEILGPASVGATDEDFSKIEVEVNQDTIADSVDLSTQSLIPSFNSPEWSDFVKSQLTEDEKQDEHPRCDGLRRLVEEFVGPIVSKKITQIKFPTTNDNSASVSVAVSYKPDNRSHPLCDEGLLLEECVSDANLENNGSPPFSSHMSAVAETRAESRAYRRILRLKNTVSAEEMGGNELTGTTKSGGIESIQIESIDRTCQRLDIDVLKFMKTEGYESISQVSFDAAAKINKTLQEIGSENKKRPENVNGYNENWKGN